MGIFNALNEGLIRGRQVMKTNLLLCTLTMLTACYAVGTGDSGINSGFIEISGASDCSWEITNETGFDILELYISDSADDSWGSDRLGSDILPDQSTFTVQGIAPSPNSMYDILAIDIDKDTYILLEDDYCLDGEVLTTTIVFEDIMYK